VSAGARVAGTTVEALAAGGGRMCQALGTLAQLFRP
jgi:hypothetical protein